MAGSNGNKVSRRRGKVQPLDARAVTIDELRAIHEEGVPVRLLTGIVVHLRPVQLDRLLLAGKVPDILTPLVVRMLFGAKPDDVEFPDEISDPVLHYIAKKREEAQEAAEYVRSIDVVCEEALVEADILPYLSLQDRMWIFKLALLRAEVLSTFRHEPQGDVAGVDQGEQVQQVTE